MQSLALGEGGAHGIHLFTWNVLSALPAALAPAQVPVGAMQGPAGATAPGLAAAPPFGLEAPHLGQQTAGIHPLHGLRTAAEELGRFDVTDGARHGPGAPSTSARAASGGNFNAGAVPIIGIPDHDESRGQHIVRRPSSIASAAPPSP